MNEQIPDIDRMIMESHYLDSLEREDHSVGLVESERKHYQDTIQSQNDTIQSLNATIESLRSDIQVIKGKLEDEQAKRSAKDHQVKVLQKKLTDQTEETEALRRELKKYKDRNERSNRDQFGKRSQKSNTTQDDIPSRQEESDKYDGTPESIRTEEPVQPQEAEVSSLEHECPQQSKERGPRGPYKTMCADMVEIVKCDLNAVPEGMRFICTKTVSEYEKISAIKETRYEVMVVEDEYGDRHDVFVPLDPSEKRRPNTETMPGTHAKPSFLSYLATARHQMSIPVYREMTQIKNEKMQMCAQTVTNWLHKGAKFLELLLPNLKKHLLRNLDVLHIDETWMHIRIKTDAFVNGHYVKKYVWVIVNKLSKVVFFLYDNDEQDSRGQRPIRTFLDKFVGGIQTDAYAAYRFFSELDEKNSRAVCWAHARAYQKDIVIKRAGCLTMLSS